MDDDLKALEQELERLRPRAPSPRLLSALERELASTRPAPLLAFPGRRLWAWAAALVMACAVGLVLRFAEVIPAGGATVATGEKPSGSVPVEGYTPVTAERTIYASADEGFITLADGTAARRVRNQFVDTIVWRDASSNASVRWSVPGEEIRLLPASFH
jgi:hypothetical protein